ncbi:MAG: fibronectin type III domain-containing protein [Flavobacteriales bacterium]
MQAVSGGVAENILSAGFDTTRQPVPATTPKELENFKVVYHPYAGTVRLKWTGDANAHFNQVEMQYKQGEPWVIVATTRRNGIVIGQLETDHLYSFRVFAVGSAGNGPMSDMISAKAA